MSQTRFILTGPPGAGKTVLIQALAQHGFAVAQEAATDVIGQWQEGIGISEPWTLPAFIAAIADLQRQRQRALERARPRVQFFDRSLFCTIALAEWLGHAVPLELKEEADQTIRERIYRPEVFFVESLAFITPTAARRMSLDEARRFGDLHRHVYARHGFQIVSVPPASVPERVAMILGQLGEIGYVRTPLKTSPLP